MCSKAGRTKSTNVTNAETGLPGKPKMGFESLRPSKNGRPGLIATLQKSSSPPSRAMTCFTKSNSPTEAPPQETTASQLFRAAAKASWVQASESRTSGMIFGSAPARVTKAASARELLS
jgi:hypothetical protein